MTILLISVSRKADDVMLDFAWRAVQRAQLLGWQIVVGDAWGIDAAVVAECNKLHMPASVWGIATQPRNGGVLAGAYHQLRGTYTQRDQHMIQLADVGLFIWNGRSPGTQKAYQHMVTLPDKTSHLRMFNI